MVEVCMIVAATKNGVIGTNNGLPWHIPEDLAYFKAKTMGYPVIMGRKTYESMGKRLLPGRDNYILTRSKEPIEGATLLDSPVIPSDLTAGKVWIIGGSEVYKAYEDLIDEICLTVVNLDIEGDAHLPFPILSPTWDIVTAEYHRTKSGVVVCYQNWVRKKDE